MRCALSPGRIEPVSNIAKFCIKHKVTTLMAVIMISIFGVVFTTRLQMALLPEMEAPAALVMCYYNGATPTDMEELVTRPLESAIMSVSGVDGVGQPDSDHLCGGHRPGHRRHQAAGAV